MKVNAFDPAGGRSGPFEWVPPGSRKVGPWGVPLIGEFGGA